MTSGRPGERRSSVPLVPWTPETRRGTFESFFAAYGQLSKEEFLATLTSPVLMTAVSTDSATWANTLVLKVENRATTAKIAITADMDAGGGDLESAAGRIYVGRTPDNDVVIAAPTVSKRHAYFLLRDKEQFWDLTDAESANGTILEGTRLKPNRRERIRRSLATIEFGPDARFVFMMPDSVYDLFQEIHRCRGLRASTKLKLPVGPIVAEDDADFESVKDLPIEVDPNASIVQRSVTKPEPAPPAEKAAPAAAAAEKATEKEKDKEKESTKPRHRATWQGKRPDLEGDTESLGKSTDKINVPVGKTPQEVEDINFDYALKAVTSLGSLVHKLEALLKVEGQVVVLLGEGSKNSIDECKDALVKMRPLLRAIRMQLVVGDRKPVEIFRVGG